MERNYIAFVSYRHSTLDTKVAVKLHRLIERYRVPKELRTDDQKTLGLVFRDEDELRISNNLVDDIYSALDNSRYLIVVCTPETPKSRWVAKEIEYFIEKHGRENILTVLAEGTPEQSIPPVLTEIYGEDGKTVTERIEPLAANIVDDSHEKVLKKLDREFLRIAAAIIGCPYDALKQRQKRYRQQQISALLGVAVAIIAGFAGMLLNRNAEINRQLEQSLKNESYALSLVSAAQLDDGDRYAAVKTALSALPSAENDRPYSPYAEKALSDALYVYRNSGMYFDNTIEQTTEIYKFDLSADGSRVATIDHSGLVRFFDTYSGDMLWSYQVADFQYAFNTYNAEKNCIMFRIADINNEIILVDTNRLITLSLEDGSETRHGQWNAGEAVCATLSDDETLLAVNFDGYSFETVIYDTAVFSSVMSASVADYILSAFSYEIYSADFSFDNSMFAMSFFTGMEDSKGRAMVLSFDVASGETVISHPVDSYRRVECCYTDYSDLAVFWVSDTISRKYCSDMHYIIFDRNGSIENESLMQLNMEIKVRTDSSFKDTVIPTLAADGNRINLVYPDGIIVTDASSAALISNIQMPSASVYCSMDDNILTVITENGNTEYIQPFTGQIYEHKQPLPDINSAVYAACGSYAENQGFCIIPDDEKNKMLFIRLFEDKSYTELEQPFIGPDMYSSNLNYVAPFSSGDYFISLARTSQSSDTMLNCCSVYDASTLTKVKDILFKSDSYLDISAFTADERKIIFSNFYYDLDNDINSHLDVFAETEQAPRLSDGLADDANLYSYLYRSSPVSAQKFGQPVYTSCFNWPVQTLYMWKDTENIVVEQYPHEAEFYCSYNPNDNNDIWLVGQSGVAAGLAYIKSSDQRPDRYCAYSAEDKSWYSVENLCTADGFPAFTVGNKYKIIASADSDGKIRIYDVTKESLIREITPQVSIASVMSLEFILSDSVLAAQLNNGNIAFIDASNGAVLGQFAVENIRSTDNAIIYENAAEQEIYLCDSKGYGTALCIDTDTWTTKYAIEGCLFILPETDTAICFDAGRNLIARHVYTPDEFISMGNELVSGRVMAQNSTQSAN